MLIYHVDRVPRESWFRFSTDEPQMEEQLPKDDLALAERLFPEADFRFQIYDLQPKNSRN
jgi:hypothetical protein